MHTPTLLQRPTNLSAPGAIPALIAFHRQTFGGWRMDAASDAAESEAAAAAAKVTADAEAAATAKAATDAAAAKTGEKAFTQADLDRLIGERLAKEKKTFDQQIADITATAGKSELEKATLERDQATANTATVTQASATRIAATEAKLAAHLGGARPDRLDAVLKQADLTGAVSDTGDVDEAKVKAAIDKVLVDYPEWKGTTIPGKSGGELGGGTTGKESFTRKQIQDMTQAERQAKLPEINAAMAEGRITG